MKTTYLHIQMSKEKNSEIYVIPQSELCNWFDQMIEKGIDVSKSFLLKSEEI